MTVWQIYKSRFLYTQGFILIACAAIYYFKGNRPLAITVFFFLQFAAVYGSWQGKRIVEQLQRQNEMFKDHSDSKDPSDHTDHR